MDREHTSAVEVGKVYLFRSQIVIAVRVMRSMLHIPPHIHGRPWFGRRKRSGLWCVWVVRAVAEARSSWSPDRFICRLRGQVFGVAHVTETGRSVTVQSVQAGNFEREGLGNDAGVAEEIAESRLQWGCFCRYTLVLGNIQSDWPGLLSLRHLQHWH